LTREGRLVPLQEQPLELLMLLVERADTLVTRDDIRARIWPDVVIDYDMCGLRMPTGRVTTASCCSAGGCGTADSAPIRVAAIDVYVVLVVVVSTAIVVVSAALAPARRAARVDVGMLLRLE